MAAPPGALADRGGTTPADYESLLGALNGGLSDGSIERLAQAVEPLLALIASPAARDLAEALGPMLPDLARFAQRLGPLVEAGLLDRAIDLLTVAGAAMEAVTPGQVERLAREAEGLGTLAHDLMQEDPAALWRAGLNRVSLAWEGPGQRSRRVGLVALMRLMHDPVVQRGLRTLLALAAEEAPAGERNA